MKRQIKEKDGTEWYHFFKVRLDFGRGYYLSTLDKPCNIFPGLYFNWHEEAKELIGDPKVWRPKVDEIFEKEVLGG